MNMGKNQTNLVTNTYNSLDVTQECWISETFHLTMPNDVEFHIKLTIYTTLKGLKRWYFKFLC